MRSPRLLASAVTLATLALAACSESREGQAQPAADGSSAASSINNSNVPLPHSGAPPIRSPLATPAFHQDPCQSLTYEQLNRLGLNPEGEQATAQFGPQCTWKNTKARSSAGVYFLTEFDEGLSQFYASQDNMDFFYAMDPVQGHPLVAYAASDTRDLGTCHTIVGLTDRLGVQVSVTLSQDNIDKEDPCAAARRVADMAITTMKGGA